MMNLYLDYINQNSNLLRFILGDKFIINLNQVKILNVIVL